MHPIELNLASTLKQQNELVEHFSEESDSSISASIGRSVDSFSQEIVQTVG